MKVLLMPALLLACGECSCDRKGDPSQSCSAPADRGLFISLTKSHFPVTSGMLTARGKHPHTFAPGLEGSTVGNLTAHGCGSGWGRGRAAFMDRYSISKRQQKGNRI